MGGLTPGEKYVCAVAAYTAEGKLIGDAIGDSTKPILASHPMPLLMTWAYLTQVRGNRIFAEIRNVLIDCVDLLLDMYEQRIA